MKNYLLNSALVVLTLVLFFSCKKDNNPVTPPNEDNNAQEIVIQHAEPNTINISQDFNINIPENSLDENLTIKVTERDDLGDNEFAGMQLAGKVYVIEHDPVTFKNYITLEFDVPQNTQNPEQLIIGRYNGNNWQVLNTYFDEQNYKLVAQSPGLSWFSFFYGDETEIAGPFVTPNEYSNIRIGSEFQEPLDVEIAVSNNTAIRKASVCFSFYTLAGEAMADLASEVNSVTQIAGYLGVLEEQPIALKYGMESELVGDDLRRFSYSFSKEALTDIHQTFATIGKIVVSVVFYDASDRFIRSSTSVTIIVHEEERPTITLESPIEMGSVKPVFEWNWGYNDFTKLLSDYGEKQFQIFLDDSDKPIKFLPVYSSNKMKIKDFLFGNRFPVSYLEMTGVTLQSNKSYFWTLVIYDSDGNIDLQSGIKSFLTLEDHIEIIEPNENTVWKMGEIAKVKWESYTVNWDKVDIYLYKEGVNNAIATILEAAPASGEHSFTLDFESSYFESGFNGYYIGILPNPFNGILQLSDPFTITKDNLPPSASFTVNPQQGTTETVFTFNSSASSDVETASNQLKVRWDFDGNGTWDTQYSTVKEITHKYDNAGNYNVKLEVMDEAGAIDTETKQISVTQAQGLQITNPNSSTIWIKGQFVKIEWTPGDYTDNVNIMFYKGTNKLGTFNGNTPTENDGSFGEFEFNQNVVAGSDYRIKIELANNTSVYDYSDYFTIATESNITVTNPNAQTVWQLGQQNVPIEWTTGGIGGTVTIRLYKGNDRVALLTDNTPNDGSFTSFDVQTDLDPDNDYKIKVVSNENGTIDDYSDEFTITGNEPAKFIKVNSPNGGEVWRHNSTQTIRWEDNIDENVKIELWRGNTLETNISASTESDGSFDWQLTSGYPIQDDYKIKITSVIDADVFDESDAVFSIKEEGGGGEMGIPCPGIPTVTYAGKTYNTVQIGDQCWLKENLNYETTNSLCYNNDPANCETYGRLYTWSAAMNGSTTEGAQGICPNGWHIPTRAEFVELRDYVNDKGAALIDESETLNYTPTVTQNETGFSALFAGDRDINGTFYNLGSNTYFWSSTETQIVNYAYNMYLDDSNSHVGMSNYGKEKGFSVRCVQD